MSIRASLVLATESTPGDIPPPEQASTVATLLWVVVPYVCLAVFVVGHWWRYRYDKFGWTTRSSQLYESTLLRWASPMFHFGILFVLMGHVMGLGIPKSWTKSVGISDGAYHAMAIGVGAIAGVCTVLGMALLIYRRRTVGPVFSATTRMDKFMWLVLGTVIMLGLWNTAAGSILNLGGHYDYRDGVSVWFRGIFRLDPHPELMADAPLGFQLHGLAAFLLFALWPFTRLVHVFSAPLGYLTRPYIVYRSRDTALGSREPKRGWERVG
jgi:nitrate reductase gamma subunit